MQNEPNDRPVTIPPPEEGPSQRNINTRQGSNHPDTPENNAGQPHPTEHEEMPKLPHERDQSVDMTDGIPSAQMQQAYRDVERGLVDTDAGREAHNIGNPNPVRPADPAQPGTPGPANPTDSLKPGTPGPIEPDQR